VIPPEEVETLMITNEEPARILLTGATGFLGTQLIHDLMKQTDSLVYCIVRGETVDIAYERVQEKLQYYFGAELDQQIGKRILVIKGDLTEPDLGLGQDQYSELAEQIDTILHTAADVRHQGKYSVFERNNVFTTRQLLEFAFHKRMKVFHHASTFGVAGWNPENRMYGENDFNTGQTFPNMPYGRSKFEAEKLVYEARKQGLRSSVYRVGNLSGRFSDGFFQPNIQTNEVYGYIKSIVMLGQIPAGIRNGRYEITPVDLTSDAMVRLMGARELVGYTYHLPHPRLVTFGELLDGLGTIGHKITEMEFQKFYRHLTNVVENQEDSVELNLLLTSLRATNDRPAQQGAIRPLSVQSEFTRNVLAKVGFTWPELDLAYLERIFKHCEAVGYFPEPGQKSVMGRLSRLFKR
jgi:thioester reductase-like protein